MRNLSMSYQPCPTNELQLLLRTTVERPASTSSMLLVIWMAAYVVDPHHGVE